MPRGLDKKQLERQEVGVVIVGRSKSLVQVHRLSHCIINIRIQYHNDVCMCKYIQLY